MNTRARNNEIIVRYALHESRTKTVPVAYCCRYNTELRSRDGQTANHLHFVDVCGKPIRMYICMLRVYGWDDPTKIIDSSCELGE